MNFFQEATPGLLPDNLVPMDNSFDYNSVFQVLDEGTSVGGGTNSSLDWVGDEVMSYLDPGLPDPPTSTPGLTEENVWVPRNIRGGAATKVVHFQNEGDAAIGADGSSIKSYIDREQSAVHKTLDETLGETEGEFTIGELTDDEDSLSFLDTDDEYEPSRLEGEEGIPEQKMSEVPVNDTRVVEPVDVEPPVVPDINTGVPEVNELDAPYEVDSMDALPGEMDGGAAGLQDVRDFNWLDPSTWRNPFKGNGGRANHNDLSEPLLEMQEMGDSSKVPSLFQDLDVPELGHHANMNLADRPSPAEGGLSLTDDVRLGLNELIGRAKSSGLSDAAVASELGLGISKGGLWISKASFTDYLKKQGAGLAAAPIMVPLVMGLNAIQPELGDNISLGLVGMDMLATGDPLGLVVYGLGQLFDKQAESRQKVIDNDTPDKEYGTRMGYVREGDTWYPAIYNQRFKSTGMFAADSEMTLDYGHEIVWKMNGEGKFVPMIPDAKAKSYVVEDDELDKGKKTWGSSAYAHRHMGKNLISQDFVMSQYDQVGDEGGLVTDPTRDWFFLSDEEAAKVMSGETSLEKFDSPEIKNPTIRVINDWRKALDHSQDWKWSSAMQTMGKGSMVNNYNGSRGLQRIVYEGAANKRAGVVLGTEADYDTYLKGEASGATKGKHGLADAYGEYIVGTVLRDHVKALYRAQKLAASEAGFDKTYGNDVAAEFEGHARDSQMATVWSSLYLDTKKDMPTAQSADELQEQLNTIEMLNDRTPAQRAYLAQKVQTRYWMQQATQMGESTTVLHMLNGRDWNNADPYKVKAQTSGAAQEYTAMNAGYTPGDDSFFINPDLDETEKHLDQVTGFAMPWQNAGESFLPTLTGSLAGTSSKDYMDEYRATAYDRLSRESVEHTTDWINRYGKLDPNLLIEGIKFGLQDDGIYHTDEKGYSTAYDQFLHDNVRVGQNSKWTVYDAETGEYVLTEEGKDERTKQDARDFVANEKRVSWEDEHGKDNVSAAEGLAMIEGRAESWQEEPLEEWSEERDMPGEDWTFQKASRDGDRDVYIAPDGTVFHGGADPNEDPRDENGQSMYDYERDHIDQVRKDAEELFGHLDDDELDDIDIDALAEALMQPDEDDEVQEPEPEEQAPDTTVGKSHVPDAPIEHDAVTTVIGDHPHEHFEQATLDAMAAYSSTKTI